MDRRAVRRHRDRRPRARATSCSSTGRAGAPGRRRHAVLGQHRLRQHHPRRPGRALPRQPRDRRAPALLHALERDGDGRERQPQPADGGDLGGHIAPSPRRPPCTASASTISGAPRAKTTAATCSTSRATLARHLRARLPGRPHQRRAAAQLPPGSRRPGHVQLSAPVADARLLAVPDRVDGPGPADGDLPGALPEVPARPRHRQDRNRKVWVFCGDGEMDEPESLGAIGVAAREKLDNLVFVVNCNLQRLDGPVRGNGKIIQELEGDFRGAGWNVIKLIWGSYWDPLLARDKDGIAAQDDDGNRRRRIPELQGQRRRVHAQELLRQASRSALEMVANMTDDDIWRLQPRRPRPAQGLRGLPRGRQHTRASRPSSWPRPSRATAWARRRRHEHRAPDQEAADDDIRAFRDRFNIPVTDEQLADVPFFNPGEDTPEMEYLHERRKALGGYLPQRRPKADEQLTVPPLEAFEAVLEPTAEAARSAPRRPSCASSPRCCATRSSARASCRSWPTKRAPSAWKACSARSASTTPKARSTSRSTTTR